MSSLELIIKQLLKTIEFAQSNHYVTRPTGFYAMDTDEKLMVICQKNKFDIQSDIQNARLVIIGTCTAFENLPQTAHQVTITPHDWRLYMPPPLRMLFDIDADTPLYFSMPHQYPIALNPYLVEKYEPQSIPDYDSEKLPRLIADEHPEWVAMYDYAWRTAFNNLRQPIAESGFVANFIDTAFNKNTFMWDSCFMTMFGRYGRQVFDFMGTLDNFYSKQHANGFICREISTYTGQDLFESLDPRSTGPNIFAWSEWLDYQITKDTHRLRKIFPVLIGFHRWWQQWRTWQDGSYWTSGLGSGMDNQSRVPDSGFHHRHYTWIDATCQQALNCKILLQIAGVIDWHEFDDELRQEYDHLNQLVNQTLWDEHSHFYYDKSPNGTLSSVKSIGAYWALLAGIVPENRINEFIAHLEDEAEFKRSHRVPSQAADNNDYQADGSYWRGGVWSPTNYMVLQALTLYGQHDLAHEIALNHVENVAQVFKDTDTLWETYAPEYPKQGSPAKDKFVGWTGVSAITIPIEYLIGLRQDNDTLIWDIRLTDKHGVLRFPIGELDTVNLICEQRESEDIPPVITIKTPINLAISIWWAAKRYPLNLSAGNHQLNIAEL